VVTSVLRRLHQSPTMTRPIEPFFLRACPARAFALLSFSLLSACGGGGDSTPQPAQPAAPQAQTITFTSPGDQTLRMAPAALAATSTSGLTVSFTASPSSVCSASGTTLTLASAGTCTVVASQAGNTAYAAAASVSHTFVVAPTAQAITFISPGNQTLGVAPAALAATSSSGLAVAFASTTTSVCTVNGSTLTLLGAGTCTLSASQPGDASYAAATPVSNTFTVAAAPLTAQTISFASPGNQTLGSAPAALAATASSGLAVSYTSTTTGTCTTSGSTLTLVAAGTCTVIASQAGNTTYAAATSVSNSFTVAAAPAGVELIADGGFETAATVAGQFALGWRGTNGPTAGSRTNSDAHTGSWSAVLRVVDPGFGGSGLAGNSVDDGGLVAVDPAYWGKSSTLTFWAKGNASVTGNVNYSLRYLDSVGNILNPVVNTSFQATINTATWSKVSKLGVTIPNGTTAVFLEMTLATGPTGVTTNPDNSVSDYGQARVLIDDVSVIVTP
jgi:hypothetical protein